MSGLGGSPWRRRPAWEERKSVLVDGLRELQPDVIAFQEVVVTDGYDQVSDLLSLGYYVAYQAGREGLRPQVPGGRGRGARR